jgi:hypothetical protein
VVFLWKLALVSFRAVKTLVIDQGYGEVMGPHRSFFAVTGKSPGPCDGAREAGDDRNAKGEIFITQILFHFRHKDL